MSDPVKGSWPADEGAVLRCVLAAAVDGIVTINSEGIILSFNAAAERIFGYTSSQVVGRNVNILMPEPYRSEHDSYLTHYLRGRAPRVIGIGREVVARRADGSSFPIDLAVSEVRVDGHILFAGIIRDISQRKKEQEHLRNTLAELAETNLKLQREHRMLMQAEKLSSIGMLAAGVAHEVNNPLSGVKACVKALAADSVPQHRRAEYFSTAQDGLDRIETVVRSLLDYARQKAPSSRQVALSEVVDGCLRLLAPAIRRKSIEIVNTISPAHTHLEADPAQLMQAVMNVLLNAAHATPNGGCIRISVAQRGDLVGLLIADNGPGIPDEVLGRVCDPFFTTKPEGEGTGLGLSVTQGIVQAHHGELTIHSSSGGTEVGLWFPKTMHAAADP